MVPVLSLIVPILVSAVFVFIASSILHMVLPFHRKDIRRLPNEDAVMKALGPMNIPPGDYATPYAQSHAAMKDPAFIAKMKAGPVMILTVRRPGLPAMGKALSQWFVYSIVVSIFAAYIAGRAVPAGGDYLQVFRFAGCTAFAAYALALMQNSIWWARNWGMTVRGMIDGLIYALLTAGTFGWLWPR
jgi:hypothetical protein